MARAYAAVCLLAAVSLFLTVAPIALAVYGPVPPETSPGWYLGRTSWYGTPKEFVSAYAPTRGGGEAAFGILEWGACGYTNSDGSMAYPKDAVSAYSDANPDYPGSCGRCYEVRCKEGIVIGTNSTPVPYKGQYYYFPEFAYMNDSQGRTFPGNPKEKEGHVYVKCWDPNKSIIIHIIDLCPCIYTPQPGNTYAQPSCCYIFSNEPKAGQHQFDLSYWAYEQLAHPMYPEMMLEFRPVDCGSGKPVQFVPGLISKDLYKEAPGQGWAWFPYMTPTHNFNVTGKGQGRGGSNAACAEVSPGGGTAYLCRNCFEPGYQPFKGVSDVEFWIRSQTNPGTIPPVKITISNHEREKYCPGEAYLTSISPVEQQGEWFHFKIPFKQWDCNRTNWITPDMLDKIDFQSTASSGNHWFCVDDFRLVGGGADITDASSVTGNATAASEAGSVLQPVGSAGGSAATYSAGDNDASGK